MKSFCCNNSWEICISGGSRQTLQMRQMYIVLWYYKESTHYTSSFIELNHFKLVSFIHYYVFGSPSTLYYIVIMAFTAFLFKLCQSSKCTLLLCTCISYLLNLKLLITCWVNFVLPLLIIYSVLFTVYNFTVFITTCFVLSKFQIATIDNLPCPTLCIVFL